MTEDERREILDAEHLRLLRLGYLIGGAANAVWALFPLIHITIGLFMLFASRSFPVKANDPDPKFFGIMFIAFGTTLSLVFGVNAVLKLLTARAIRNRQSRTFCLIVAAITTFGIPYGTALGVSTFMVLSRPSIETLFAETD
jgi:hypothetical protein